MFCGEKEKLWIKRIKILPYEPPSVDEQNFA